MQRIIYLLAIFAAHAFSSIALASDYPIKIEIDSYTNGKYASRLNIWVKDPAHIRQETLTKGSNAEAIMMTDPNLGKDFLLAMKNASPRLAKQQPKDSKSIAVINPNGMFTWNEGINEKTALKITDTNLIETIRNYYSFGDLKYLQETNYRKIRSETVNGKSCDVYKQFFDIPTDPNIKISTETKKAVGEMESLVWLTQSADHTPVKSSVVLPFGTSKMTTVSIYKTYLRNQSIPEVEFNLPAGWKVLTIPGL